MAFSSKSVNDIGDEIDRPKSCRGNDSSYYQNSNTLLSGRTSTISHQASSIGGIFTRYINPAVCTAKIDTSMESLSDVLPPIVPPLDLNSSGETMPSTDSAPCVSYTIQKTSQANSSAFYNWLSGKKKLKSYEQAKQKEIEEKRQQELEKKKQLAEQKYQEWLAKKTQQKEKPLIQTELQEYREVCQTLDDSESNRKAWEHKKLEEQRRKREQILKLREQQRLLEEKRKQQATKAWQNWIAEAPLKPKPVPLNQGFLSLKGTISDIYINPNPWHEPFEEVECE